MITAVADACRWSEALTGPVLLDVTKGERPLDEKMMRAVLNLRAATSPFPSQFPSHPPPFAGVRGGAAGWRLVLRVALRTQTNGEQQTSKACVGAILPRVQIPPPPRFGSTDARHPRSEDAGHRCLVVGAAREAISDVVQPIRPDSGTPSKRCTVVVQECLPVQR